ncbi:hypothetical protein [Pelagerythrobacter rhizovicinus]|uniref:Uncharacterized protein n=1 Tax=Pelagerythrobacter rhizovicinus TaxID=2268576 RepID=A0A4Q2KMN3_9SPHN|nr:hypothetical protein [Pelagerythrobacter rhizovicinus]RXZ65520.1 hypothetical protein ETX26_01830 [Pelagerythrobacter rhizovicinus]
MSDASFASLNSSLLARKGGARPAMRPQSALITSHAAVPDNVEDLGWNDMGADDEPAREAEVLQLTPSPANHATAAEAREIDHEAHGQLEGSGPPEPPVRQQQAVLAERMNAPIESHDGPVRRSALKRGKRAAFTLRLDAERHLKLRLACTVRNRSAQQIVTEALDALLARMPELDGLAAQIERQ